MRVPAGQDLENAAVAAAQQAAELIRGVIGNGAALRTKSSPTDVVTPTDLRAEQLIRRELERSVPGSSFIGEEYPEHEGTAGIAWVIDPIDGTVNFLYDLPVIAVSIAAEIDGVVVAGAVCDVLRHETFSASREMGARRDGDAISSSSVEDLAAALVATGYSYDAVKRAEQATVVGRILPAARDIRSMGSAALQLCWVGCGRLDAYYERDLKRWDIAAGALIAREAGAVVEFPSVDNGDLTVTAPPAIFDSLRSLL